MKLTVTTRQDKKVKDLRKEGLVPAIIYGKHIDTPIAIACNKNEFIKRYKEAGYSTPLTLEGDKMEQLVLIQDIQVDPVTDILMHVDFLAVKADEKVTTEVAIKLIWESSVEKLNLWKIQLVKDFIEVKAFPQDLPHDITIDISSIQDVNDAIFVKDLKISDKVEILDDAEQVIVTVVTMTEEETETAAAPAEGTSPAAPATPAKEEKK
jgi:large subunit ribosomal protein L25